MVKGKVGKIVTKIMGFFHFHRLARVKHWVKSKICGLKWQDERVMDVVFDLKWDTYS